MAQVGWTQVGPSWVDPSWPKLGGPKLAHVGWTQAGPRWVDPSWPKLGGPNLAQVGPPFRPLLPSAPCTGLPAQSCLDRAAFTSCPDRTACTGLPVQGCLYSPAWTTLPVQPCLYRPAWVACACCSYSRYIYIYTTCTRTNHPVPRRPPCTPLPSLYPPPPPGPWVFASQAFGQVRGGPRAPPRMRFCLCFGCFRVFQRLSPPPPSLPLSLPPSLPPFLPPSLPPSLLP